jgi:DNA ligase-1
MKRFSTLYNALDTTTSTNEKVAAMVTYFSEAPPADAAWMLFFLTGRRFKRFISSRLMWAWFQRHTGMADWLFSDSYEAVGDTAETISLLMDNYKDPEQLKNRNAHHEITLSQWIETLQGLKDKPVEEQQQTVLNWWQTLERNEIFLVNKLLSGSFRVGVAQTLVVRAIAQVANLPAPTIEHRLMGNWEPTAEFFEHLVSPEGAAEDISRPYPFYLAYPLDQEPAELGAVEDWLVEWKWDGIRAQLIKRNDEFYLWSRGEELVTHIFK